MFKPKFKFGIESDSPSVSDCVYICLCHLSISFVCVSVWLQVYLLSFCTHLIFLPLCEGARIILFSLAVQGWTSTQQQQVNGKKIAALEAVCVWPTPSTTAMALKYKAGVYFTWMGSSQSPFSLLPGSEPAAGLATNTAIVSWQDKWCLVWDWFHTQALWFDKPQPPDNKQHPSNVTPSSQS